MDYQVRTARITDVDRLVALFAPAVDPGGGPLVAPDLLRQLIYLPQASVLVAERRREVIGGAILALRPSVRSGGYIGSIDLFVVDPSGDATSVTNDLLEEILRSARNKGCTVVEAAQARRSRRASPLGRSRLQPRRLAHDQVRGGPPGSRAPDPNLISAELHALRRRLAHRT